MRIPATHPPLSCTAEGRHILLSANLDPVSAFNAFTHNEVTLAYIDHRTLSVALSQLTAGEPMRAFDLTGEELERLFRAYRAARYAHKRLLAHLPDWSAFPQELDPYFSTEKEISSWT